RAHDILAGRWNITKIFRLQIEMSILPGLERFLYCLPERREIVDRATALIVLSADCRLGELTMTVAKRIAALAVQLDVLGFRESGSMQAMRGMEDHLHP